MPPLEIKSAGMKDGLLVLDIPIPQAIQWLETFKAGRYEIKPYSEPRSRNANSYCWLLCDKIASKLGGSYTKEDIYRRAVKDVGIYKLFEGLKPDQAATLAAGWQKIGIGWVAETDWEQDGETQWVRAYYGSSVYNRKQMSRLIDYIVEDAKSIGVPTDPTEKIESLLREWEEHEKRLR